MRKRSTKKSSSGPSQKENEIHYIGIDGKTPALIVKYLPESVIRELYAKYYYLYVESVSGKIPLSMTVGPDAPLAGLSTLGFALEPYLEKTASGKRPRAYKEKELEGLLKTLESKVVDETNTQKQEGSEKQQDIDVLQMYQVVGRKLSLAKDYIAENLSDKLQGALLELIMEASHYASREFALENGLRESDIKGERALIRTLLQVTELGIKNRLQTRGRGGKNALYDFDRLPEFYEQGKELFGKAMKTLDTLKDLDREKQFKTLSNAYPDIDLSLIEQMLGQDEYLSTLSHLSAEWAGRRCGLPADRDSHPTTYLLQVISNSKNK